MLGRVLAIGEQTGRLDHDVRTQLAPRQRRGVALGEHAQLGPVHHQPGAGDLDRSRVGAQDGVVFQEVPERPGIREVVDRHPLDVRVLLGRRAERVAADATEPVDPDPYRHA